MGWRGNFRRSDAFRAGQRSRVNSRDNLIFNQPTSPVTLNPTIPSGATRRHGGVLGVQPEKAGWWGGEGETTLYLSNGPVL